MVVFGDDAARGGAKSSLEDGPVVGRIGGAGLEAAVGGFEDEGSWGGLEDEGSLGGRRAQVEEVAMFQTDSKHFVCFGRQA